MRQKRVFEAAGTRSTFTGEAVEIEDYHGFVECINMQMRFWQRIYGFVDVSVPKDEIARRCANISTSISLRKGASTVQPPAPTNNSGFETRMCSCRINDRGILIGINCFCLFSVSFERHHIPLWPRKYVNFSLVIFFTLVGCCSGFWSFGWPSVKFHIFSL